MIYYDPDDRKDPLNVDAFRDENGDRASDRLPVSAQRTLDEIAEALNTTATLLQQSAQTKMPGGGPARLIEASALLQAFIRIEDAEVRRSCVAFVQAIAERK